VKRLIYRVGERKFDEKMKEGSSLFFVAALVIVSILLMGLIAPVYGQYVAPHTKPGPAVDSITFKRVPLDLGGAAVEAKEIDAYIFGLRPSQAKAIAGRPGLKLISAPTGTYSIILNPAPAPAGELNPFTDREIRFALNYLINRDFVVKELFAGFGAPMVTYLTQWDYDYISNIDLILKYDFRYDPAYASQIIEQRMRALGAEKVGGKWFYQGKPVTIKFIIRVEDERRQIGDAIASDLEKIGFTVERMYMEFGPAIETVYDTDPAELKWQMYTEGWGKTGLVKFDNDPGALTAPWEGNMPGWAVEGWWQYKNDELDRLTQKLFRGEFSSKQERDQMMKRVLELALTDAVRLWVATRLDSYIMREELTGITQDLGAGLRSMLVWRNAYIPGKSDLSIGHLWVWTTRTTWNPMQVALTGGFIDVYSVDIGYLTADASTWFHPYTGMPMPFRGSWEVRTAGPTGKIIVPKDAYIWDAAADKWVSAGGAEAKSVVTFDYSKFLQSKWHHGIKITLADLLYHVATRFDLAFDKEKSALEPSISSYLKASYELIKGIRVLPDNKVEVYIDYWFFEPAYIASFADLWPTLMVPWEVIAATDRLNYQEKKYAYGSASASARGVKWINLVLSEHAKDIVSTLQAMKSEGYFPASYFTLGDRVFETPENAQARYDAAISWGEDHRHMWISNGPFYLDRFDSAAQTAVLKAFRDPTYPFKPGDNFFPPVTPVHVLRIGKGTVVPGATAQILIDAEGEGLLKTRYLIRDVATGQILKVGDSESVTPKRMLIRLDPDFTSKLTPGALYELIIATYSEDAATISIAKDFFEVLSLAPIEREIESVSKELVDRLRVLSDDLAKALTVVGNNVAAVDSKLDRTSETLRGEIKSSVEDVRARVEAATNTLSNDIRNLQRIAENTLLAAQIVMALAVIAIVLSIVSIIRRPSPAVAPK
jgi:peptide/nickel transport system substrate-binding protein